MFDFTFRFMIYFQLIFQYGERIWIKSHFYVWIFTCSISMLKDGLFSTELLLHLCGNKLSNYVWIYFWILQSIPLISLPVSYCFDYYNFMKSIKSRRINPPIFFFSKFIFAILNTNIPYRFWSQSVNLCKITCWGFDWDYTEYVSKFRKNWHLNNMESSGHEHSVSLHVFRASLISHSNIFFLFRV